MELFLIHQSNKESLHHIFELVDSFLSQGKKIEIMFFDFAFKALMDDFKGLRFSSHLENEEILDFCGLSGLNLKEKWQNLRSNQNMKVYCCFGSVNRFEFEQEAVKAKFDDIISLPQSLQMAEISGARVWNF